MDPNLRGTFGPAAQIAVDRLIHATRPDEYHSRWPLGRCPLCTPLQNGFARTDIKKRIREIVEGLE